MIIEAVIGYLPWEAGRVVGLCQFRDHALLATEHRVYRLTPDWLTDSVHLECISRAPPMPNPI